MNDDYKQVLITLVSLSRGEDSGQVKRSSLANAVKVDEHRLKTYLDSLQHAQYIQIEKRKNVTFITPTIQGLEKSEAWENELKSKSLPGRLRSATKWLIAGLATALLGLIFWYFGFSPDTIGLQPFDARIPIKVYEERSAVTGGWYVFTAPASSPKPVDENIYIFEEEGLNKLIGSHTPVNLSGDIFFKFTVENVASKYQVDISSVNLIVKQESIKDIEDLFNIPFQGLGGGGYWNYEVTVSANNGKTLEDGNKIYPATLISNNNPVDYIYIRPGERETFYVNVKLDNPGKYLLTPQITYSFRDKTKNLDVENYSVVYPRKYRPWVVSPPFGGALPPKLNTNHFIVDNNTGLIDQETPTVIDKMCFPGRKWLFFTSTMVISGVLHQTFVIDTNGENLRLLDSSYADPRNKLFVAWTKDGKVRLKYEGWIDQKQIYFYELFDPQTGEKLNWNEEVEKTILPGSETSNGYSMPYTGYSDPFTSLDGQWIVSADGQLRISRTDEACGYIIIKPNYGEIWNLSLQP